MHMALGNDRRQALMRRRIGVVVEKFVERRARSEYRGKEQLPDGPKAYQRFGQSHWTFSVGLQNFRNLYLP
jgi:hypothetical protein